MDDLNVLTSWLIASCTAIGNVIFTKWGILGTAIFCIPILRKIIKIFSNTY